MTLNETGLLRCVDFTWALMRLLSPKRGAGHCGSAHQAGVSPQQRTVGLWSPAPAAEAEGRARPAIAFPASAGSKGR